MVGPTSDGHISCGWTFHQDDTFDRQGLLQLLQLLHIQAARVKGVFRVGPKTWVSARTVQGRSAAAAGVLGSTSMDGAGSEREAAAAEQLQQQQQQQQDEQLRGQPQGIDLLKGPKKGQSSMQQEQLEDSTGILPEVAPATAANAGVLELVEMCYRGPSCIQVILAQDLLPHTEVSIRQQLGNLLSSPRAKGSSHSPGASGVQHEQLSSIGNQIGEGSSGDEGGKNPARDFEYGNVLSKQTFGGPLAAAKQGDWLPLELMLYGQLKK
jgi:hypothetical protein